MSEYKNNSEYIKDKFENDGIETPESLSEKNILKMISDSADIDANGAAESTETSVSDKDDPKKEWKTTRGSKTLRKWIAVAACALIALIGIPELYNSALLAPNTDVSDGELYTFKSEREIDRTVRMINKESPFGRFMTGLGSSDSDVMVYEESEELAMSSDAAEYSTAAKSSAGDAAADHSDTYLQVEGVDEADIVKVDGKYIYCVNRKQEVAILETDNGKTKKVATIGNTGVENYIHEIFLKDDTLVTVGRVYDANDKSYIAVVSYNINDRSNPVMTGEFRQSGSDIVASRMTGDYVYLVTNMYAYANGRIMPKCTIDGNYTDLPASDISCVPDPQNASYVILSAVDVMSGKKGRSKTKAVLGATSDIYCNDRNLYIAISEWDDKDNNNYTRIVRAGFKGLDIAFNATSKVRGYIDNQFSMDEYNGYFRIATTSERNGMDVNNLYVLDDKLKESGKLTGFARDESIRAVRFMGDKAYVITYEQIDPLFIIDLADPTSPRIEGEVKIDGFSSLLVPIGKGRLLGIGHATGDNGYGGEYDSGLKLALFDISNPSEPKVLDSKEFENMTSPAQNTHLALTVNDKEEYYAIPYGVYSYEDGIFTGDVIIDDDSGDIEDAEDVFAEGEIAQNTNREDGVLVYGISENGNSIEILDRHKLGVSEILRSVYVGDYIYGLDRNADAYSFKFTR